ncbi:MAG: hypothetical protein IPH84_12845 [Bacteroidales bacterium]|nr:hypothetical protein [Bacteroidales bacterium]
MSQAQGSSGSQFGTGIADQVTIELHNATSPYAMEYSYENVNLLTDGMILINSLPGTISGNYYIVVKNRNSIETWSATAIDFSAIGTISYDFSTAVSQAFGNNLKLSGTDYLIWGGDANPGWYCGWI